MDKSLRPGPGPGLRFCTYRGSVYVSGAVSVSVSAALCVSAVAVWELIKGLQSAGQLSRQHHLISLPNQVIKPGRVPNGANNAVPGN